MLESSQTQHGRGGYCGSHRGGAAAVYAGRYRTLTDVVGTRILLKAGAGIWRQDSASSISPVPPFTVAGTPPNLRNDPVWSRVGPYGEAKIKAEAMCEEYLQKGMCVPNLSGRNPSSALERLGVSRSSTNGPRMDGKNFPMIGNGRNRYTNLMDVEDLCGAIGLACITTCRRRTASTPTSTSAHLEYTTMREDVPGAVLDEAVVLVNAFITFPAKPGEYCTESIGKRLNLSPLTYPWDLRNLPQKKSFVSIEKSTKVLAIQSPMIPISRP
jgi:hypothetical protein